MAYNLKEVAKKPERFTGGHRMCAGCGAPIVIRQVLRALKVEDHAVIGAATGCLEVSTFLYPYTALKRKGKINQEGETKFIAFGGDGGTYDIGIQALSGALERGHDMVYVCYDNGAYMNTGIQRSSATPLYADTTTSPAGKVKPGKQQWRKDLTEVVANHHIPYVAQTAPLGNLKDLYEKAEKAIYTPGPAFLNVLAPCPRGWRYEASDLMTISKLAVETCFWPLYEIIDGKYIINYKPKNKLPVVEFLKVQGRFKHLFKKGNEALIDEIQAEVDRRWEKLLKLAGEA